MKLLDICETIVDCPHSTAKDEGTGYPLIRTPNVGKGRLKLAGVHRVSENVYNQRNERAVPQVDDLILAREAPVGNVAIIRQGQQVCLGQRTVLIRPNKKCVDPDFLVYYLLSPELQHKLLSSANGATVSHLNMSSIRSLEVQVPDIEVQKRIGAILARIDDKIELNNAINENLEQQAQAIYAQMFIESAEESWETGSLSDIAVITMGQSPKGDTFNETGEGAVFYQGRTDFGFRFPTRRLYTTEPKRIALCGDALMSVRAPVGDLNVAYEECCIGRGLAAIHSKDNHQSFVLYTLFTLKKQLDVFNSEGTVFGSINKESLNSMEITIPPRELMDRFESIVSPIDRAIRNNYEEICRLQAIRETLLPKLMNGEIDVSAVKI